MTGGTDCLVGVKVFCGGVFFPLSLISKDLTPYCVVYSFSDMLYLVLSLSQAAASLHCCFPKIYSSFLLSLPQQECCYTAPMKN